VSYWHRDVRYVTDDFGNLWRFVTTASGIEFHYIAPMRSHADDLHDEWGSWNLRTILPDILSKNLDDRGNLMSPAGLVNDLREVLK
jgi:hypothetical protein